MSIIVCVNSVWCDRHVCFVPKSYRFGDLIFQASGFFVRRLITGVDCRSALFCDICPIDELTAVLSRR